MPKVTTIGFSKIWRKLQRQIKLHINNMFNYKAATEFDPYMNIKTNLGRKFMIFDHQNNELISKLGKLLTHCLHQKIAKS